MGANNYKIKFIEKITLSPKAHGRKNIYQIESSIGTYSHTQR